MLITWGNRGLPLRPPGLPGALLLPRVSGVGDWSPADAQQEHERAREQRQQGCNHPNDTVAMPEATLPQCALQLLQLSLRRVCCVGQHLEDTPDDIASQSERSKPHVGADVHGYENSCYG